MLARIIRITCRLRAHNILDPRQLLVYTIALRTIKPRLGPIDLLLIDNIQHILSRVLLRITLRRSVALKVAQESRSIVAKVSKVNGLSTLSEQEEVIELLEEDSRRLMDSSEDSLSIIGKFAKEGNDGPGGLRVETRGWLVQEEKKSWLGGELDSDGEELALLYVESWEVLVWLPCVFVQASCMKAMSRRAEVSTHKVDPRPALKSTTSLEIVPRVLQSTSADILRRRR